MRVKIAGVLGMILGLAISPSIASAQELTAAQVVAKLDEKAKVFTTLEASISQAQVVEEFRQPVESGKIFMKVVKAVPSVLLDITTPRKLAKTALIKDGTATAYFRDTNTYRTASVDPKSNALQLLLTGFGVPAETLNKFYSPQIAGREVLNGIQTVVLELNSISSATGDFKKVTLWLDTKTWTPVQTRLTEKSKDYTDFKYSNVRLNKGISDSVFKLNIPRDARKQ